MTTPAPVTNEPPRSRPTIGRWTSLGIPVAVFLACILVDLSAGAQDTAQAPPAVLLALLAGVMQIVVLLALAPWWGASLAAQSPAGARIAALRVATLAASTGVLLFLLALLQPRGQPLAVLRVQTVVLGVGLFAAGLAAALAAVFRGVRGAAAFTTLAGFALTASPFWGNLPVRLASDAWRPLVIACVVRATPISACANAIRYDLFRGQTLYDLSIVSNYPYHLPAWWLTALLTGASGILLLELAAFLRSRRASLSP